MLSNGRLGVIKERAAENYSSNVEGVGTVHYAGAEGDVKALLMHIQELEKDRARLRVLQRDTLTYLEHQLNEHTMYRGEMGLGDEDIERMQGRAQSQLIDLLKRQGCELERDDDFIWNYKLPD